MIHSIRVKLLASLMLVLGLSFVLTLTGIWSFGRDRYSDIARAEAMRMARTLQKTLHHAMAAGDGMQMVRQAVRDVREVIEPDRVSIVTLDGTVVVSSDAALIGRRFARDLDAECTACHVRPGILPQQAAILIETGAGPMLRNVIKLANEPQCQSCHGPERKNLGIFIYDASFDHVFAMLQTVLFRAVLAGIITFLLLAVFVSLVIQRCVHRPLRQLEQGFLHVGRGDFNYWTEVDGEGEIQDMAVQFNVMSQAIKRSFAEIKRKNWENQQLYTFVQQLSRVTEWQQLRQVLVDLLLETFAAQKVAILLHREEQGKTGTEVFWCLAEDRLISHLDLLEDEAVRPGELPDWAAAVWEYWRRQPEMKVDFSANDTRVMAPLVSQNISLGLLYLSRDAGPPFSKMEKNLLAALTEHADQLSISLKLQANHRELAAAHEELKASQAKLLQQEKLASIGQLAAGVAHEINNPIGFVNSNLGTLSKYLGRLQEFITHQQRLLEQTANPAGQEEGALLRRQLKIDFALADGAALLQESLDGVERVKFIVQNLKDFSRVDQQRFSRADINQCLDQTLNIVAHGLEHKATIHKEYGVLPLVWCCPQQLNLVFTNLLMNAAQAIGQQGEIRIRTWAEDEDIFITISDTGSGIAPENLGRLFDPFFTTREVGKGTGLGLSIVYDIVVKQHGGEISATSEPGRGTTFRVRLPVRN